MSTTQTNATHRNENIETALRMLDEKSFTVWFFVPDTHGTPSGLATYEYQIAKTLFDMGYDVKMIYQLKNEYSKNDIHRLKKTGKNIDSSRIFEGVGRWLGEEYEQLPHLNISCQEVAISPADIMFIPEAFSSFMQEAYTHRIPCRKVVICHSFNYITDSIPFSATWGSFGIDDCVTNTQSQRELIQSVFPTTNLMIVPPMIADGSETTSVQGKDLVVNVVAKNPSHVEQFVKTFYWKYPIFKFVSFRDVRNFPYERMRSMMREAVATIWIDQETPFGYTALEAMAHGSMVIGRVPEVIPDWMIDQDGGLTNSEMWCLDRHHLPDTLARVLDAWLHDDIPSEISRTMIATVAPYTKDNQQQACEQMMDTLIKRHRDLIESFLEETQEASTDAEPTK